MLIAVLELAFIAVFLATLVRFLRRRQALERDVAAAFAPVALLFVLSLVRHLLPGGETTDADLGVALLASQPFLTMRVVAHFGQVPRALVRWLLGALAGTVAIYILGSLGPASLKGLATIPVALCFFATEALAVAYLGREATRRTGVARARLATASLSSALLGLAILFSVLSARLGGSHGVVATAAQVAAVAAALGYLFAFVPPGLVRRLGQRAVAYGFLRDLDDDPAGATSQQTLKRLAESALAITGAGAAIVLVPGPDGSLEAAAMAGPLSAAALVRLGAVPEAEEASSEDPEGRLLRVPIRPGGEFRGEVVCYLRDEPLFAEDDVALIETFGGVALQLARQREMGEQLRRANSDLARASAAKSEFLAAMSHELRTPLNAVIGFSELLLDPAEPAQPELTREFAGHIRDAGMHLLDLINDVLDLSKVEAGRLELHREEVDLAELVGSTLDSMRPLADRKGISISVEGLESRSAQVDPGRIRQVAYNLLSNAIKFTPQGGRIAVRLQAKGEETIWSVQDSGPGIPEADREKIFEAFVQGRLGGEQKEGTGLGLALTRRLVELHGGRLELHSEVGQGSEFRVVLPATTAPRPGSGPLPAAPVEAAGSDPKRRVLVIEDDSQASRLLEVYLGGAGYSVESVASGEAGLRAARSGNFQAVLLDIVLSGIDGWQVLTTLKADPATRQLPVLVVSVVENRELGLALGAFDYLVKPIHRDSLLRALANVEANTEVVGGEKVVLAIDDDPAALRLYQASLRGSEIDLRCAPSGKEGLRLARQLRPSCVLLDLIMPDLDGFEVLAQLKSDPATAPIPVIVISAAEISVADKARLNGHVLAVVAKGDVARQGLAGWLTQAVSGPRSLQHA